MDEAITLHFDRLAEAMPFVLPSFVELAHAAAAMCFHHHHHPSGLVCTLRDLDTAIAALRIVWTKTYSDEIRNTFGETDYAVEFAAEGIACLIVRAVTEYTAIERSVRHDGIDFWLGLTSRTGMFPLQRAARMECKGVTEARYPSDIIAQLKKGIAQSIQSDHTELPAYIIVAEFSQPVIYMVQR